MRRRIISLTAATALLTLAACAPSGDEPSSVATATATPPTTSAPEDAAGTSIVITAGDETVTAVLNDSQVSRDFIATLPTTSDWYRNSGIEYITELAEPLTETGPFYTDVEAGDLVYYNPMDSITIIYEPTVSVPTLTKMGEITSDLAAFRNLPDDVEMTITVG